MTLSGSAPKKGRYWATLSYPDSCSDVKDKLSSCGVRCILSPLHDSDVMEDGSPKKPHHHVLFFFPTSRSYSFVFDFFKSLGLVGAERVTDYIAYTEYLWHKNDSDKHLYLKDDCVCFNGAEIKENINEDALFSEFVTLLLADGCTNLKDAFCIALDNPQYMRFVRNDAYCIKNILSSISNHGRA